MAVQLADRDATGRWLRLIARKTESSGKCSEPLLQVGAAQTSELRLSVRPQYARDGGASAR